MFTKQINLALQPVNETRGHRDKRTKGRQVGVLTSSVGPRNSDALEIADVQAGDRRTAHEFLRSMLKRAATKHLKQPLRRNSVAGRNTGYILSDIRTLEFGRDDRYIANPTADRKDQIPGAEASPGV